MTNQYSRLIDRTYDDRGVEVTVVEPVAGLAPGWVTVMERGDRRSENLQSVLKFLSDKPEDVIVALDILETGMRIQQAAVRIAASVSDREPPDGLHTLSEVARILEAAAAEAEAALSWLSNNATPAPGR